MIKSILRRRWIPLLGLAVSLLFVMTLGVAKAILGAPGTAPATQHDGSTPTGEELGWNYRTERLADGTKRYEFHVKQINYKDADGIFKPINVTPIPTNDGWEVTQNTFIARFPVRSTGAAEMVNNNRYDTVNNVPIDEQDLTMTITAEGVADVQGVLEYGDVGNGPCWYIRYPQAYPALDADLIFLVWHGKVPRLQKLIRFNSALAADTDVSFEFSYLTKDPDFKKDGVKWDKNQPLHSGKGLAVGNDGDKHGFGFRDFRIWDSGTGKEKHVSAVDVDLQKTGSKTYTLTKHVPASFFSNVIYPVYADTTSTFYPDPNAETSSVDGGVQLYDTNQTWAYYHDATAGNVSDDSSADPLLNSWGPVVLIGGSSSNRWDRLGRAFFLFDTSSITAGATIKAATLSIYGSQKYYEGSGNTWLVLNAYSSTPASNTAIVNGDFDQVGSTAFSTGIDYGNFSTTGYNNFALSTSGIANITIGAGGMAKFGLRSEVDGNNSAPAWSYANVALRLYFAEQNGTDKDPKLVVWTDVAGPHYQIPSVVYGDTVTSVAFVNLLPGDFVFCNTYQLDNDGNCKADLADADTASTMPAFGLAAETCSAGNACKILVRGYWNSDSHNWTLATATDRFIYPSTTAGAATQT